MAANGWGQNWGRLEQYFIERMISLIGDEIAPRTVRYIVWQESNKR